MVCSSSSSISSLHSSYKTQSKVNPPFGSAAATGNMKPSQLDRDRWSYMNHAAFSHELLCLPHTHTTRQQPKDLVFCLGHKTTAKQQQNIWRHTKALTMFIYAINFFWQVMRSWFELIALRSSGLHKWLHKGIRTMEIICSYHQTTHISNWWCWWCNHRRLRDEKQRISRWETNVAICNSSFIVKKGRIIFVLPEQILTCSSVEWGSVSADALEWDTLAHRKHLPSHETVTRCSAGRSSPPVPWTCCRGCRASSAFVRERHLRLPHPLPHLLHLKNQNVKLKQSYLYNAM